MISTEKPVLPAWMAELPHLRGSDSENALRKCLLWASGSSVIYKTTHISCCPLSSCAFTEVLYPMKCGVFLLTVSSEAQNTLNFVSYKLSAHSKSWIYINKKKTLNFKKSHSWLPGVARLGTVHIPRVRWKPSLSCFASLCFKACVPHVMTTMET